MQSTAVLCALFFAAESYDEVIVCELVESEGWVFNQEPGWVEGYESFVFGGIADIFLLIIRFCVMFYVVVFLYTVIRVYSINVYIATSIITLFFSH